MKKLSILFLLIVFTLISCNDATTDPESNNSGINLIGAVTFSMVRTDITGRNLGEYYQTEHVSGIKVELMKGATIIATTYTVETDSLDCFFLFDNIEKNVDYRLKASLNDEVFKLSEPFTISDDDLKEVNKDDFIGHFGSAPDWFEKGIYYLEDENNTSFNFDFIDSELILALNPQPIREAGGFSFILDVSDTCSVKLLSHNFEPIKDLYFSFSNAGNIHLVINGDDIVHGFYLINIRIGKNDYYYPISVLKYRDDYITTPYKE